MISMFKINEPDGRIFISWDATKKAVGLVDYGISLKINEPGGCFLLPGIPLNRKAARLVDYCITNGKQ